MSTLRALRVYGGWEKAPFDEAPSGPIVSMGMEHLGWFCSKRPMGNPLLGAWQLPREMVKAAISFEFGLHL